MLPFGEPRDRGSSVEEPAPVSEGYLGYGRQCIEDDDIEAVVAALRSPHLTQGPRVAAFEAGLRAATGARHALCVTNGTTALQLAYLALGAGPGHTIVTAANTFLGTATAALWTGAEVRFGDIDRNTGNLSLDGLAELCGPDPTRAIVVAVHFAGLPCDMEQLLEWKRQLGFRLVEDAAHALGARYSVGGRMWGVGEHPEVDAACLSFHPVKQVTTGEGGAVLTSRDDVAARLERLRGHGMEGGVVGPFGGEPTPWFRAMLELGFNARMSDVQAALGASQLAKLPRFLEERRALAARYRAALDGYEHLDGGDARREHAWHLYCVRVPDVGRDELIEHLQRAGIGAQVHYVPVPTQPWFRLRYGAQSFPGAEDHGRRTLSLPLWPGLGRRNQERVIDALVSWRQRVAA